MAENLLYLLRHGETDWSATGRHTGRTDVPLNADGERQARAAAPLLAGLTDPLVLASPKQRALRTAELAGLSVTGTTEALTEWDYGDYEGSTTEEIRRSVPGWTLWSHPVPDGESPGQVAGRADGVLARARNELRVRDVVLVGHGHFSRVLIARWLGLSATSGVHFAVQPAHLSALGTERGVPQLRLLNSA